jgi:hypothetical protein
VLTAILALSISGVIVCALVLLLGFLKTGLTTALLSSSSSSSCCTSSGACVGCCRVARVLCSGPGCVCCCAGQRTRAPARCTVLHTSDNHRD